ncbi:MAG TPA: VOC family protein [Chloroflexota bacterium]
MGHRYTHTRLLVDDYTACHFFYRDVMGLNPTFGDENSGYADFNTGDVSLALFDRQEMVDAVGQVGSSGEASDRVMLIFEVDDVDQSVADLRAKGVSLVARPEDHPDWGIRTAHIRDPAGNLLEIYTSLQRNRVDHVE